MVVSEEDADEDVPGGRYTLTNMSGSSAAVLMLARFGLSVRVESVALTYGGVGIEPGAIVVCKKRKRV